MSACIARQSSLQLPSTNCSQQYPYSINFSSQLTSTSCRKRLYSEQNEYSTYFMKHSNDKNGLSKRTKHGNYVIDFIQKREWKEVTVFDNLLVRSPPFAHSIFIVQCILSLSFLPNRWIQLWVNAYKSPSWNTLSCIFSIRRNTTLPFCTWTVSTQKPYIFTVGIYKRRDFSAYIIFNINEKQKNNS